VVDIRNCEQCGGVFVPRREHARFCCVRCRDAWNDEHAGGLAAGTCALEWSIIAMTETTELLPLVRAEDRPRAFAVIGEAVWWVTIVDATLVRHHAEAYDGVMAGQPRAEGRRIEGTLAGLRFVRNQIGQEINVAEFIDPGAAIPGTGGGPVKGWTWTPAREPALASLPARARSWEMARYRAYQADLVGHPIGEIFGRAVAFLQLTAANATVVSNVGAHAAR
jgi:hypothetical protein